ncbi:energy transducer TonB [Bacteroidales bacterium OttesenSCG-928-I14]|nr:energy transducer TonB [Bacteroidales bacterium OttesenSCG-928-I14]
MKVTKEQIIGFSVSAVILLLFLILLMNLFLHSSAYAHEEEQSEILFAGGLMLEKGDVDWEGGTFVPQQNIPTPDVSVENTPGEVVDLPAVITEEADNTLEIAAQREKERQLERERLEQQRRREEQRRQEEINNQMTNLFGQGSAGAGQGSGTGASTGASGTDNSGGGGYGDFDLGGRGLYPGSRLPRPSYSVQEEGTIVVEITVDPQGNVISAQVRTRGTNVTNPSMRKSATEAARKAKFAVINESNNQYGTITYRYKLN